MRDLHSGGSYEWASAALTFTGEDESGDLALVVPRRDGTLAAVVDGLGHGSEAAAAARTAIETLRGNADEELEELVRRCHRALKGSRGAVISLAITRDDGSLTWTGVGNVEAVVARLGVGASGREHAVLLGGVLGMQIPPRLRPSDTTLAPGDTVIFATDGIRRSFVDDLRAGPPQRTADHILRRHATGRDDALVLVGQYRKGAP